MTRLRCSHDKDKLQPLKNISTFFLIPSPSPQLFYFFLPLGVVQMFATLKGDGGGGGCPSPFTGQVLCFMMEHALCRQIYAHGQQTPPTNQPLKLTKKDSQLILDLPHNMFRAGITDIHCM